LTHPEIAAEMGASGRRFVEMNFQWSALVRNWIAQLSKGAFHSAGRKPHLNRVERESEAPLSHD